MQVKILAFAQAADRLGFRERDVDCTAEENLRTIVHREAPNADLTTFRVAIDHDYASWDSAIGSGREIAVIPPVSGG